MSDESGDYVSADVGETVYAASGAGESSGAEWVV